MPFVPDRTCDNVQLLEKQPCSMPACWNSFDYFYDGNTYDEAGDGGGGDYGAANRQELVEIHDQNGPVTIHIVETPKQSFCKEEPMPGACRGHVGSSDFLRESAASKVLLRKGFKINLS